MNVGRIVFGPQTSPEEAARFRKDAEAWRRATQSVNLTISAEGPHACNCIGPQPGETKCPCRLRAESRQGARMVRDGVVIDGVEYDLVPRRK